MTLNRLIMGLVQPLLALLLMAGMAQAQPCLFDDDDQALVIERSLEIASTLSDRTDASQAVQAPPASSRDDHPEGPHALAPSPGDLVLDRARLIRTARVSDPTAPPSPWPCAAPSTGPPLV